jgi:signal transduction histidine kinase/Na+/proline symporter
MSFSLTQLLLAGIAYLSLLFGVAHAGERGWIPERWLSHPLTYTLSLGVFGSATLVYGVVGIAYEYGYGFLAFYAGIAGTFLFAPLLLAPLLRICRLYQLSSLADLLTFRFRSQWAGSIVTLFMLFAVLPLLALQIQAVADTMHVLTDNPDALFTQKREPDALALVFCCIITLFTILFGSKQRSAHQRHNGLVAAIAFESALKLVLLLILGGIALFSVFGGLSGLDQWLNQNPDVVAMLSSPVQRDPGRTLMLLFFAFAICMPHMFHMVFAENPGAKALQRASWGFSIYLLLLSLPVLPILWAGFELDTYLPPEYFALALGIERGSPSAALMVYVVALSAGSATTIVITLAMASMCLNHLILPFYQPSAQQNIYRWLLWIRRLLIGAIILAGYVFYRIITGREELSSLAMASCVAVLQFMPGVLAVLYWQRANRVGFLGGLCAGFAVWFVILLLPLISEFDPESLIKHWLHIQDLGQLWSLTTIGSLALNAAIFALLSALIPISDEERAAAEVCSLDDLTRPVRHALAVRTIQEIRQRLATSLGETVAEREINRALTDLNLKPDDKRPYAFRRLRYRLETNLSGLLGPSVAQDLINRALPFAQSRGVANEDINLTEARLERYQHHLTGLAADLDSLRRHHRQTLQDLPIGLCSLGRDREILMWNGAMETLTGIAGRDVVGSLVSNLPAPWGPLLDDFFQDAEPFRFKQAVEIARRNHWLNLHKTGDQPGAGSQGDGQVIMVEDITETQMLEDELVHSERLASIGRLAAGVAHEIGNPVTGIACLAQNLRYDTGNPESLKTADEILKQTGRISRIVQSLVNFAHAGVDAARRGPQSVPLRDCVEEAIHLLQLNKNSRPVEYANHCDANITVLGDHQRLLQVFVNLLSNARDASVDHAPIEVENAPPQRGRVHVSVTDAGSGISAEHLEKIFEPFFTTKEPGQGTGLGLALVYGILEELGGDIDIESPVPGRDRGTRIHLWLPEVMAIAPMIEAS